MNNTQTSKTDTKLVAVALSVKNLLDVLKIHPRESYSDVIKRLIRKNGEKINPENFNLNSSANDTIPFDNSHVWNDRDE